MILDLSKNHIKFRLAFNKYGSPDFAKKRVLSAISDEIGNSVISNDIKSGYWDIDIIPKNELKYIDEVKIKLRNLFSQMEIEYIGENND